MERGGRRRHWRPQRREEGSERGRVANRRESASSSFAPGIHMNAAEHIVESYFRLCRGCFTLSDRKVKDGNNRHSKHLNRPFQIEVISLRDLVLPELEEKIETANYNDEILRTLTFIKRRDVQRTLRSGRKS
jgi:hypothetical protein